MFRRQAAATASVEEDGFDERSHQDMINKRNYITYVFNSYNDISLKELRTKFIKLYNALF